MEIFYDLSLPTINNAAVGFVVKVASTLQYNIHCRVVNLNREQKLVYLAVGKSEKGCKCSQLLYN